MTKTRRSFLSLLGLGAAAAPLVVKEANAKHAHDAGLETVGTSFDAKKASTHVLTLHECPSWAYVPLVREGDRRHMLVPQMHGHSYDNALHEYRGGQWRRLNERKA